MFELIFINRKTGLVNYAVTDVTMVRHITPSEVSFTERGGRIRSCSFPRTEKLEVERIDR